MIQSVLRPPLILLACALFLTSCGGGGGGSTPVTPTTPVAANQAIIAVEQNTDINPVTQFPTVNLPYVSVKVCDTTGRCQTIDHVVLDTGSYGLRLLSSAVSTLTMPIETTTGGGSLAECATFLGGYMWGGVHTATSIQISGEIASNVPIQVIADPSLPSTAPTTCQNTGSNIGNLYGIGGNGLLGVGLFVEDQGSYYTCVGGPTGTCSATVVAPSSQVSNPVAFFPTDNNGVILQMPAVPITGQLNAFGTLTFGVDTQSNNTLAAYSVLPADSGGNFTAAVAGQSYGQSFLDSGSNYSFITLPLSTNTYGDYAPTAYTTYPATLTSNVSTITPISTSFGVIDSAALNFFNTAFNDIVDPGTSVSADFGMPFFYGRAIAFVISGKRVTEGMGPLYALH